MKRYIIISLILGMMFLFTGILSACNQMTLTLNENFAEEISTVGEYFSTNVFDKESGTNFDLNTSDNFVTNENYYVMVASDVTQTISKIKLNEITYANGTDVVLAVGNSNTISRLPFKVLEEELHISAPLLFLNAGKNGIVRVSFPDLNIMAFDVSVYEENENTLNIDITASTNDVLQVTDQENFVYNFKSDTPNNSIFVVLKDGETVLNSTAVVIIEKIANPSKTNQSVAYSYSTPTTPAGQEENGIQLFPGYNSGQDYTVDTPADHKLVYNIYVVGVGSRTVILNFENTFTQP